MSKSPRSRRDIAAFARLLAGFVALLGASDRRRWLATLSLMLATGLLEGLRLSLLLPIIEGLNGHRRDFLFWGALSRSIRVPGLDGALGGVAVLAAAFFLITLGRAGLVYFRETRMERFRADFVNGERSRMVERIAATPWADIVRLDPSRMTSVIGAEIPRLGTTAQLIFQTINSVIMVGVQLLLALALAPGLALTALAALGIGGAVTLFAQGRVLRMGQAYARSHEAMFVITRRFLGSLKGAIAQDSQWGFVEELSHEQSDLRARQMEFAMARARRSFWVALALPAIVAAVVLIGTGTFGVRLAVLVTMMLVFARMIAPAVQIRAALQNLALALPGFAQVAELEAELARPAAEPAGEAPTLPDGPVEMLDVAYDHGQGRGLKSARLVLQPGEFVGVVGPSGQGKTTLIDILATLLPPQSGSVRVGGLALDSPARRRAWQRQIGYVPQEGFLFNDSLRRNLAWGARGADDAAMLAALEMVGAGDWARRIGGLDGRLGDGGALISGGERQRVAIARVLLRRPRLMLMDESTSAIDVASEADLLGRLAELSPRPTILMVSHRQESLSRCDRVIEIRNGRLEG
jgi:ATP-binding cassette subfamily C protein